ncbi:MAG: hypothetical protein ACRCV7_01300 [Culicoidibacterales bacterium]
MECKQSLLGLDKVHHGFKQRCSGIVTILAIQDFMMCCTLCVMCLFILQLLITSNHLKEEKKHYEVLYYYMQTKTITDRKNYQAIQSCVEHIPTKKRLCATDKRIFHA